MATKPNPLGAKEERLLFLIGVVIGACLPLGLIWSHGIPVIPGLPRSDFEYYFYPLRVFISRWLLRGILPYWNPHLFCGYPVVESVQSTLFYPFNKFTILFQSHMGLVSDLSLHILILFFAQLFALRYAFGVRWAPAAAASAILPWTGMIAHRLMAGHATILNVVAWLPLALAASVRVARWSRSGPRWLVVGGVATAFMLTGGAPQFAVYGILTQSLLMFAFLIRPWWATALRFLGMWALAAAISAPQWLPTLYYLPWSARAGNWTFYADTGLALLVNVLETLLHAPLGDGLVYPHMNSRGVWDTAGYFGTAALLSVCALLVYVVCYRQSALRTPLLRTAFVLVIVGFYVALGGEVPGSTGFRTPHRGLVLCHLAVPLLLAWLLDARRQTHRSVRSLVTILVVVCGIYGAGLVISWYFLAQKPEAVAEWIEQLARSGPGGPPTGVDNFGEKDYLNLLRPFRNSLALATVFCGLTVLCGLFCIRSPAPWSRLWPISCAVVFLIDPVLSHWRLYRCVTPLTETGWPPEVAVQLEKAVEVCRTDRGTPCRVRVPTCVTNAVQLLEDVGEPSGYDPLMPLLVNARAPWFSQPVSPEERREWKDRVLGVAWELIEDPPTSETVPMRQHSLVLNPSSGAGELASLESSFDLQPETFHFGPIDGTTNTLTNPESLAVVRRWLGDIAVKNHGQVLWERVRSPSRMRFVTHSSTSSILVVRVTWLPGWKGVWPDGHCATPLRVNGWMMGVPVREGVSSVEFVYTPVGLRYALFTALVGIALSVSLLLGRFRSFVRN